MSYDIVGDVHGHADKLRALLARMGYTEARGAYRHSSRSAIFVGDLIDRGPANIEAAETAHRMVEEGSAHIVMGNHEFNALAFHTEDPDKTGHFLRERSKKNEDQHRKTLDEFQGRPDAKRSLLAWFGGLPLFLDLPEIRVVHACWDRESVAAIQPFLNSDGSMPEKTFIAACRKGSPEHRARDALVNGPEIKLPNGVSFLDKDGHRRYDMRLKWWLCGKEPLSFREAGIGLNREQEAMLPADDLPEEMHRRYAPHDKPVFFGHYWLTDLPPKPSSPTSACVDYSVALGGTLVAYRWDGETELRAEKFVTV